MKLNLYLKYIFVIIEQTRTLINRSMTSIDTAVLNKIYHVIVPRKARQCIVVQLPITTNEDQMEELIDSMVNILRENDRKALVIYLDFVKMDSDTPETTDMYRFYILSMPSDILVQLKENSITKAIMYIGFTEDTQECRVLDGRPLDKDIAFHDREEYKAPYETPAISFG